jgi:predicted transcriptional regulator
LSVEQDKMSTFLGNFINDFLNGDIEIMYSRAKKMTTFVKGKNFLGGEKQKEITTVCNDIGFAITNYVETKSNPIVHQNAVTELFSLIVLANTHQLIKRTKILKTITELNKENAQLKEEKNKLEKENQRLKLLNEQIQSIFDKYGFQKVENEDSDKGEEF